MQSPGVSPRIRASPFFASSLKFGATEFHPYDGMGMPVGYDTPVADDRNVVERASLRDVAVQLGTEVRSGMSRRDGDGFSIPARNRRVRSRNERFTEREP